MTIHIFHSLDNANTFAEAIQDTQSHIPAITSLFSIYDTEQYSIDDGQINPAYNTVTHNLAEHPDALMIIERANETLSLMNDPVERIHDVVEYHAALVGNDDEPMECKLKDLFTDVLFSMLIAKSPMSEVLISDIESGNPDSALLAASTHDKTVYQFFKLVLADSDNLWETQESIGSIIGSAMSAAKHYTDPRFAFSS